MLTEKPILVTGATGFLASHVVEQLLQKGYKVRGTVRKLGSDKNEHLLKLDGADKNLELVELNLLGEEESFFKVVEGVEYIIHTASPFSMNVKDPQKDLVDPAVKGTLNVFKAAEACGGVKRIVLTSSMAAVTDEPVTGHVYTENDWNQLSSLSRNPYYFSKTVAEKAAWKFIEDLPQEKKFSLVVMNPYLIVGPSHSKLQGINDSVRTIHQALNGEFPGMVDICWGFVDVRDVAKAHVLGLEKESANGRYLLVNPKGIMKMRSTMEFLKQNYPAYPLPSLPLDGVVGTSIVWLSSFFQPGQVGQYIRCSLGNSFTFDPSKAINDLNIEYTNIDKTLNDTVESLIEQGFLTDKRKRE